MKINKIYAFIILVIYCISLTPSLIFHEHNDSHNHDELSHCQHEIKIVTNHIDCSHDKHYESLHEDCILCNYHAVYDHILGIQKREYNNILFVDKIYQLCERLYLHEVINSHNKSPPVSVIDLKLS